jgi:hypothetical protein
MAHALVIDAKRHLFVRMRMETREDERDRPASTVVVDRTDDRVTDGLILPYRTGTFDHSYTQTDHGFDRKGPFYFYNWL